MLYYHKKGLTLDNAGIDRQDDWYSCISSKENKKNTIFKQRKFTEFL